MCGIPGYTHGRLGRMVLVISKQCRFQFGLTCVHLNADSGHKEYGPSAQSLSSQLLARVVERCFAIIRAAVEQGAQSSTAPLLPSCQGKISQCQPFIVSGATPELENWNAVELVMASAFRIQEFEFVTCE